MTTGFIWLREGKVAGCVGSCSVDVVSSYFVHIWKLISSSRAVCRLTTKKGVIYVIHTVNFHTFEALTNKMH